MPITKEELEEVIEELEQYKGKQTELITVYISSGYDVNAVQKQLESEKSTAKNIKSATTRKNVGDALDKIVRHLKSLKKTPKNGLAIFCGDVSKTESQQDLQLWAIEPPMPLKMRLYRCDKEFVLQPLREMLAVSEIFGLLVMDRKEATIGLLEGKRIELIQKMTSGIPGKVRAGGQCLSPDTLIKTKIPKTKAIKDVKIGDKIKAFDIKKDKIVFTKVKKKWNVIKNKYLEIAVDQLYFPFIASEDHAFFKKDKKKAIKVLAKDLNEGDLLIHTNDIGEIFDMEITGIKKINKKLEMVDIETDIGNFFANWILVHNSSQRFHRITEGLTKDFYKRIADEMKKIFFNRKKLKGILIGGPIPTKDEFIDNEYLATQLQEKIIGRINIGGSDESGLKELVEKSQNILASQEIIHEKKLMERFFESLGKKTGLVTLKKKDTKRALEYGAVEILFLSKAIDKKTAKEFKKIAENTSANIEIISRDTEEGQQFYNLGGIGALLRFMV